MIREDQIREVDLDHSLEMLKLLSLQLNAYHREAELIGLSDAPPLYDTPGSVRSSGERFIGYYRGEELLGAAAVQATALEPSGRTSGQTRTLTRLMVHPDHTRQGIGKQLIGAVLEHARSTGATEMIVRTPTNNYPALGLYSSQGFRPRRELEAEYGLRLVELVIPLEQLDN